MENGEILHNPYKDNLGTTNDMKDIYTELETLIRIDKVNDVRNKLKKQT